MDQAAVKADLQALKAELQQPIMNQAAMEAGLTALKTEQQQANQAIIKGSYQEELLSKFIIPGLSMVN